MNADPEKAIRVLYVEDAVDQALVVKAFLQSSGNVHVVHVQDGDLAARLVQEEEWHLLVTDLNLPGLDGFELCRIAKAAHPSLPVLAVTGYTGADYQDQAFRAGATDLMTKPLLKEEFLAKVGELTGLKSAMGRRHILAIGGLVGDVEMGCGGSLVQHRKGGVEIHIAHLCQDEVDATRVEMEAAQRASRILGAHLVRDEVALVDTQRRTALLERLVKDLRPEVVYMPAMDDIHPARREAFGIGKLTTGRVATVLCYQTATTGLDFRPSRFRDVGDVMAEKMAALTAYHEADLERLDLAPRLAQAYARYWGRLERFTEVEAFETVER